MNDRDTTKVYKLRLDTGCGPTLYRKCHSHNTPGKRQNTWVEPLAGNCSTSSTRQREQAWQNCKIQKNWCTVTVAQTIEHHGGHSRTPANQVRPGAREDSASPAWLAASAMNARNTTKVYILRLDTGCGPTLYRKCHSHNTPGYNHNLPPIKLYTNPWPFYRTLPFTDLWGVHITFATGVACWQGTLTPPDTCSRPIWDLHMFYLSRPILFPILYFFRTIRFEHPSVLSRFGLELPPWNQRLVSPVFKFRYDQYSVKAT